MSAIFSVIADADRDLVQVVGGGFFSVEDVQAFGIALEQAHAHLRCPPNRHMTIADLSDMHIQSQDVVQAFAEIAQNPRLQSRRMAMILGASLARGQARRVGNAGRHGIGYFADRQSAEAWLFAETLSDARTAFRYRRAPASPMSAGHGCIARSAV